MVFIVVSESLIRLKWLALTPALVTALALPFSAAAQPAQAANYAGVHLGQNNLNNWPAEVNFGGVIAQGRLALDDGVHGGLLVGRQTDNARFEVEYQHGRIDVSSVQLGPVTQAAQARGRYQVLMLNAYRTFALLPSLSAYVGAGLGWSSVKLPRLPPINGCNCFPAASQKGAAFQARVGAEYLLAPGHGLFLQYTALRLPGPDFGGVPSVDYSRRTLGAITAGYRASF